MSHTLQDDEEVTSSIINERESEVDSSIEPEVLRNNDPIDGEQRPNSSLGDSDVKQGDVGIPSHPVTPGNQLLFSEIGDDDITDVDSIDREVDEFDLLDKECDNIIDIAINNNENGQSICESSNLKLSSNSSEDKNEDQFKKISSKDESFHEKLQSKQGDIKYDSELLNYSELNYYEDKSCERNKKSEEIFEDLNLYTFIDESNELLKNDNDMDEEAYRTGNCTFNKNKNSTKDDMSDGETYGDYSVEALFGDEVDIDYKNDSIEANSTVKDLINNEDMDIGTAENCVSGKNKLDSETYFSSDSLGHAKYMVQVSDNNMYSPKKKTKFGTNNKFATNDLNNPDMVETTKIVEQPTPDDDDEFCILRLPPNISFDLTAFNQDEVTREQPKTNDEICVRWQYKRDENGIILRDAAGNMIKESNTNLVEWEDGSYSLFIDDIPFDCQSRNDRTYVFEDSDGRIKPLHVVAQKRIQAQHIKNMTKNRSLSTTVKNNQPRKINRKTKLTFLDETLMNEFYLSKELENMRELKSMRIDKRTGTPTTGLTRHFLEESDDDVN